ncbi:MAG: DUF2147 domain-containing protein [Verrucomicrobiota bacterium]
MRKFILSSLLFFAALATASAELTGDWTFEKGTVRISETDGVFTGKAVEGDVVADSKGNDIISEFKADGNGYKGKVYAPPLGKYLDATASLKDAKTLSITIRAGLVTRTQTWKRSS